MYRSVVGGSNTPMADVQLQFVLTRWLTRGDDTNIILDGLRETADQLYDDTAVKSAVGRLRAVYNDKQECLQHRDMHTGSVISSGRTVKVRRQPLGAVTLFIYLFI